MKLRKPTKKEVVLLVILQFLLFALVGFVFNVLTQAVAWSISIFLVEWMAYWSIKFMVDMAEYMKAMMPAWPTAETEATTKKNNKRRRKNKRRNKK